MRLTLAKAGGLASLTIAATYLFGFALFIFVLDSSGYEGLAGRLAFATDNWAALTLAMIVLYLVCGSALIVLVCALYERMRDTMRGASLVAAGFGLAWATLLLASGMVSITGIQSVMQIAADDAESAATIWAAVGTVQNGLGGGIEFVGGAWSILVSIIALKTGTFSRPLAWLGIALGLVGLATAWPLSEELTSIFGLGQIVWFIWLGVALIRPSKA
ncbi:DUF4386 family protein [Qipengyuania sp. DSG2-2]|uniref:DUF4386 family protein n=1 Tax=Qipengyuania sp. DGS2-2 TaxID=3349631 RepID=UPI0036D31E0C